MRGSDDFLRTKTVGTFSYLSVNRLTGTVPAELDGVKDATKWSFCNNSFNQDKVMELMDDGVLEEEECTNVATTSGASPISLTTGLFVSAVASLLALSA
eukprot:gene5822-7024_t